MKILTTGSDGYIGSVLGPKLLEEGYEVIGLDTGYYRYGWLYNPLKIFPEVITKDVRKVTEDDLKGFDAVVHMAELSNDPLGQNNPEITYDINHKGTMGLAEKAKKAGVKKFIYFSSCSVYGASENLTDETSPTNPLTAYAKSKILNEEALKKLADDDFTVTIMRNATVFGPSPRIRFDLSVNNLSALAWTTKEIKMDSDGTPWRPFVHVEDVAQAVICILKASKEIVQKETFNIGSTESNYQIKMIAEAIKKALPECEIIFGELGGDKRNYRVSFEKINTKLPGFKCKKNLDDGIRELLEIFKKINLTEEMFLSRSYTRLKQVDYLKSTHQIDEFFYWT